ncbi:TraB/GumN family protein [Jeotgalibacillus sp. ET6]|uniref:TraB/GumN family protein n=1 Tax=Jeotgalibacillus sp. ET6 TaxID=3037260 RepID=UPI0024187699|nr:TraB/GumN family protein [Jeotgalibacillus sp. ET6]MDG5472340.1 TraB/GumN family protein [Jeotgalibacillus sp. ET6]
MLFAAGCSSNDNDAEQGSESPLQETEEETSGTGQDYEGDGGLLWKVVHGETTMYVQGTIHLGHEDFYPLAPEIEKAYESSDVVLPEINMFEAEVNEEEINEMALFEGDTNLDDVLSEEAYAKLSDLFEENEMAIENYEDFEPWFIGMLLGEFSHKESDLAPEYGVDLYFLQRSLEDNKEIVELETIELQYDVLSGNSMKTQVEMLESTLENFEETGSSLDELGYDWIHGDKDGLVDQLSEGFGSFDEEYQLGLNDNRNINMANKLDEILQRDDGQTYFVIIGSAHVVIEPSVLSELEKDGYEIERVY